MGQKELTEYRIFASPLMAKIPTEFETFIGNPDFEVLGSVLAMQVSRVRIPGVYIIQNTMVLRGGGRRVEEEMEEHKREYVKYCYANPRG